MDLSLNILLLFPYRRFPDNKIGGHYKSLETIGFIFQIDLPDEQICRFFPISKPGCLMVLMEGVTTSEKGSLLNPTIKILSGTFNPFWRR